MLSIPMIAPVARSCVVVVWTPLPKVSVRRRDRRSPRRGSWRGRGGTGGSALGQDLVEGRHGQDAIEPEVDRGQVRRLHALGDALGQVPETLPEQAEERPPAAFLDAIFPEVLPELNKAAGRARGEGRCSGARKGSRGAPRGHRAAPRRAGRRGCGRGPRRRRCLARASGWTTGCERPGPAEGPSAARRTSRMIFRRRAGPTLEGADMRKSTGAPGRLVVSGRGGCGSAR